MLEQAEAELGSPSFHHSKASIFLNRNRWFFINLSRDNIFCPKAKVKIFSNVNLNLKLGTQTKHEEPLLKTRVVVVTFLVVVVTLGLVTMSPVKGQSTGSQIAQVFPSDLTGVVGQTISVLGSIDTRNGKYEVYLGRTLVVAGTAQDNAVSAVFKIPETPEGFYTLILRDTALNQNATKDFMVSVAYYIEPIVPSAPSQLQEGSIVALNITITGGQPNTVYKANITVILPAPLSTNYSRLITLPASSQKGTTITQINYPDSGFVPSGSLTNYAGVYRVYFNLTDSLASNQFSIGLTNLTQYHRGQTVKIRAIGYQSNDTATVTVKNVESGASLYTIDVAPTNEGIVTTDWPVPSDAAIGDYEINVTALNNKAVPDLQVITVPGYPVRIKILDLSGSSVPQIVVEALDAVTNKTYSGTSRADGEASINIESGQHTITAFWNGLKVGETAVNVVGEGDFDLSCELTNIKITVYDWNGLLMPSVNLNITYAYLTTKAGTQRSGIASGQTDISGMYILKSTPPGINYTLTASIYGNVFNSGNDTVSGFSANPVSEVTIICPARTLMFKILDYNRHPIPNARLALLEVTAGIFYGAVTDSEGSVTVNATFGRYQARVYSGSVLLNETVIDVFTDKQVQVQCVLYNLQITVKVGDYFGQPIANANVHLVGPDGTPQSEKTRTDGLAIFNEVTGGDMQIIAYLEEGDNYYESRTIHVESPTTIQVQMGRYIALGSVFIQTSLFISLMIILPIIALFLFWEIYRGRKSKSQKAG
jgi:hypothetical protein